MERVATYNQIVILKHYGKLIDVKVSLHVIDGVQKMYIRDLQLYSFEQALRYLRYIAETEVPSEKRED